MKKAVHHLEAALGIASSLDMVYQLFWINHSLAEVFCEQGQFENAQIHVERAKSLAVNDTYLLAWAMYQQALLWSRQRRFVDAKSEASRALDAFEKLEAAYNVECTRQLLHNIEARRPWRFKWRW